MKAVPTSVWCLLLCVAFVLAQWALLATGVIEVRDGDMSSRFLRGISGLFALDRFFEFPSQIWRHFWPPLPFYFNRLIFEGVLFLGIPSQATLPILHGISALFGGVVLWLVFRIMERISGDRAALLAVLVLMALPSFSAVFTTILGQVYTILFVISGLWFVVRAQADDRTADYVYAGLCFLLGTLCKSEAIFAPGAVCFGLLLQRRYKGMMIVAVLALAFIAPQQAILFTRGSFNYFQAAKTYDYSTIKAWPHLVRYTYVLLGDYGLQMRAYLGPLVVLWLGLAAFGLWSMLRSGGAAALVFWSWSGVYAFVLLVNVIFYGSLTDRDYLSGFVHMSMAVAFGLCALRPVVERRLPRVYRVLAATLLLLLAVGVVRAPWEARNWYAPSKEIAQVRDWLIEHREPGDRLMFSFYTYSHYLVTRLARPDHLEDAWAYNSNPDSYSYPVRRDPVDTYELYVFKGLQYLFEFKPRYVVTLHPLMYDALMEPGKYHFLAAHMRLPSHLIPYATRGGDDGLTLTVSAPDIVDGSVVLHPKFQTRNYMIFETEYPQ